MRVECLSSSQGSSQKVIQTPPPKIKGELIRLRHHHDKHQPEYFASIKSVDDFELSGFDVSSLKEVRAGRVPYGYGIDDIGYIIFGKVKISDPDRYIFVRWFMGVDDEG